MSNWEHVDKEEIIISEEGLDEAIHNAYLKGRNDVLDKIRAEILEYIDDLDIAYEICGIFEKYEAESEEKR